jgi:hypothetical protein
MAGYTIPNAPTNISLQEFRSAINRFDEVSHTARFAVTILPVGFRIKWADPILRDLVFLTESTEFPARGIQTVPHRYYGPIVQLPIQTEYRDITIQFYCRTESFERQFFDDWMEIIQPTTTFDFHYLDDYKATIRMFQFANFSEDGNSDPTAKYSWTLHNIYPVLVNVQPISWAENSVIQRLSVTFNYTHWTRDNRTTPPYAHELVLGSSVTRSGGKTII